jgi:hypothetical protein
MATPETPCCAPHPPSSLPGAFPAAGAPAGFCLRRNFWSSTRLHSSAPKSQDPPSTTEDGPKDAAAVDLKGLKQELSRQIMRAVKKAGKSEQRLRKAVESAGGEGDELELLEQERDALRSRLQVSPRLLTLDPQHSTLKLLNPQPSAPNRTPQTPQPN